MKRIPTLLSIVLLIGCGSEASCGAAQVNGRPVVVDCTIDNRAEIVALGLSFDREIQLAASEHRPIAWSTITRQAIDAGVSVGGCALARLVDQAIDKLFRARQSSEQTLVAAGSFGDERQLELDIAAESRKALERVRAEFGARYIAR